MTPSEFREGRLTLGLSQSQLARLFLVSSARTIRRWETGERDIPGPAVVLMRWLITSKRPTESTQLQ